MSKRVVVIALGGNAILPAQGKGTLAQQFRNVDATAQQIADLIKHHYKVVITHGNGPQAGSLLVQQEHAEKLVQGQPLDICDAMTQGQIGYMLQNRLWYHLNIRHGITAPVCTLVTQVEVNKNDPGLKKPTKPVGTFHTKEEADNLRETHNYIMKNVVPHIKKGWRRVVPSPKPVSIIEADSISQLVDNHVVVIACGGGGIPVIRQPDNSWKGVEAVVDKDWTASLLAKLVDADYMMILTDVEKVSLNWGKKNEKQLDSLTVSQVLKYYKSGEFPEGSMGPKVLAAAQFVKESGETAIISSLRKAREALAGKTGTRIIA